MRGLHTGVRVEPAMEPEAAILNCPRLLHALADVRRLLTRLAAGDVPIADGWDIDVEVDPVEQRARNLRKVALDGGGGTGTFLCRVGPVAAGTGIHGADQHEIGR